MFHLSVLVFLAALATPSLAWQTPGQSNPAPHLDSAAYLNNLVNQLGDRFGPLGEDLKEALNDGSAIAYYADNIGSHGATQLAPNGTRLLYVSTATASSNIMTMMVLIHEEAHSDANHPPNQSLSDQQVMCNEAEAICSELCAISHYASWANSQTPPAPKLPCPVRDIAHSRYRLAWELCHENYYPGDPAGCPCAADSNSCS